MTPEKLKQISEFLQILPKYRKQLIDLEQKLYEIGQLLLKEYHRKPQPCPCCNRIPRIWEISGARYFPWRCECSYKNCENNATFCGNSEEEVVERWNSLCYDIKADKKDKANETDKRHED